MKLVQSSICKQRMYRIKQFYSVVVVTSVVSKLDQVHQLFVMQVPSQSHETHFSLTSSCTVKRESVTCQECFGLVDFCHTLSCKPKKNT